MARVAVVGGGPAGLMAAETLAAAGVSVVVHERMPSLGRKFLMAGRGGLNLTHSEPFDRFLARYGEAASALEPILRGFSPADLRAWANALGQETFVGSSGRVFPKAMKASPLLRAWLGRLAGAGVEFRTRSTWRGWTPDGAPAFDTGAETADAVILALGGASWSQLGSDGAWASILAARGVAVAPFRPANGGFTVAWSPAFRERFAGAPLKNIALTHAGRTIRGEAVIARYGLEGGAVYALSAALREAIAASGPVDLEIDLRPDRTVGQLTEKLSRAREGQSTSNLLRKAAGLSPVEANLLREGHGRDLPASPRALAQAIKQAPIRIQAPQLLDRAISTAGGVALSELDENLMLGRLPGVFAAGEMLDWEAPTGGYLLQACFATGKAAALGVLAHLGR